MLARGRGERGYEAWALRLLGDIASHRGRLDVATAEAHYGAAMNLASELEMRPLLAHCHFGLGRLYRRTSNLEEAQQHLITATAMYAETGMTYWREKLDKSNQDFVPSRARAVVRRRASAVRRSAACTRG